MLKLKWSVVVLFALLPMLSACQRNAAESSIKPGIKSTDAAVDSERMLEADSEPGNWMSHGRTYSEQRYSTLDQVQHSNVKDLGLDWSFDLETQRGIEATSIVVDGVMYLTSAWSIVYALDGASGELLWRYDPGVDKVTLQKSCCGPVNRGVAVWEGQVFVGALDGRLIALDAATGDVKWEVITVDQSKPYTITGAPRVVKGKVLIGNGGAEFGVRGYLSAYDATSGDMIWRFYTVPGNPELGFENDAMEMAAKTWNGQWWAIGGGGGTVWDSMAYDPELDLLYFGVGNGTPWNQEIRSPGGGDNLFLSSIVAVRPNSGEYVWHYQTTPGESWDYTATQHIILADIELEGKVRKVLMQAPKNGFFYLIDRSDGTLLSANNYIDITWATHVDMATGRPVEVDGARYTEKPFTVYPAYLGGHNWHPMSFSPETGLVYIPVLDVPAIYAQPEDFVYRPGITNIGLDGYLTGLPDAQAERDAIRPLLKGRLVAWDPVTQSEAWRVEHSGPWNGGTLSTAGNLVFQGTADGKFVAYRADTGERLWDFTTQTGVVAPPITYTINDEQYVSINVGWGGIYAVSFGEFIQPESLPNVSRVLTFKLGANGELPELDWKPRIVFNPPAQTGTKETHREGYVLYQDVCASCHGLNAVSGMLISDLRSSGLLHSLEAWNTVVRDGALKDKGMGAFGQWLDEPQSSAIRDYIIQQAWRGQDLQKLRANQEQ